MAAANHTTKKYLLVLLFFVCISAIALLLRWYQLQQSEDSETSPVNGQSHSLITLTQLLSVEEVRLQAMTAYRYDTASELIPLQVRLLDTARELNMSQRDIDFINSPRLFDFLFYQAAREWFEIEMTEAYQLLQPLMPIKAKYPEAQDLFAQADVLFKNRDDIIAKIANELAQAKQERLAPSHFEEAKAIWLAKTQF